MEIVYLHAAFIACLNLSANPLDDGWYGEDRMCFTPLAFKNWANSTDTNCGPLSDTSWSGNPWALNTCRSTDMVFAEVVDVISYTSDHLEWASTMIKKKICPKMDQQNPHGSFAMVCLAMSMDGVVLQLVHPYYSDKIFNVLIHTRPPSITSGQALHLRHPRVISM